MFKCDGYPPPPERKKRKSRAKPKAEKPQAAALQSTWTLPPTLNQIVFSSDLEGLYFHHFLHSTTDQLASWHDSSNFWLCYALPLAHTSQPIRYSMIAVGAAHRLFMAHSVSPSQSAELKRLAISQYNKAIKAILPLMSATSVYDLHSILICCILFICFEGLTGRYDDLLRHLRAGNRLLSPSLLASTPEQAVVTRKLVDMLSPLGSTVISFMDKDFCSGVSPWYKDSSFRDTSTPGPFRDLDEASYELQRLEVQETDASWVDQILKDTQSEQTDDGLNQAPRLAIEEGFRKWTSRFEATKQAQQAKTSSRQEAQLRYLRLGQQFRKLAIHLESAESSGEDISDPALFTPLMNAAKSVAEPFLSAKHPTFSLNGELIRCLSYIAGLANQPSTNGAGSEALDMLRRLNRREGFWDSNDVVRMHELLLAEEADDPGWCMSWQGAVPAGVPGFLEELKRAREF
ncbi:hypothetical protein ACHAPT_002214 [Fusarium lateritium]